MTHTYDAQTVHTSQTRSVCKPRPPACIQGPASIRGNTVIGPCVLHQKRYHNLTV